ncbi:MAG: phage tail sheath subtilisin-like domain-containing protein, partial [Anaerolineaceae bacterium]
MAQTYLSPGVYVEEVDRGTKPIEAVGTSLAAFLGITAQASLKAIDSTGARIPIETRLNKPTLITSWTQFTDIFGDFVSGAYLPFAVYEYFANGGSSCYITSLRALEEAPAGAAPELVIPAKPKGTAFKVVSLTPGKKVDVVVKAGGEEDFSLTVDGQTIQKLSVKKGENYVGDADFKAAKITNVGSGLPEEGTYTLAEVVTQPLTVKDFIGDVTERTGLGGFEAIDEIRLVVCPDIFAGYDGSQEAKERVKMVQEAMIAQCEKLRYRFAILDTPPGLNAQQAKEWRDYINFDSSYAALYYPWIQVADLSGEGSTLKLVPPSGAVAGVYNRVDADRGVHKAPANEVVLGAIDLELRL